MRDLVDDALVAEVNRKAAEVRERARQRPFTLVELLRARADSRLGPVSRPLRGVKPEIMPFVLRSRGPWFVVVVLVLQETEEGWFRKASVLPLAESGESLAADPSIFEYLIRLLGFRADLSKIGVTWERGEPEPISFCERITRPGDVP